MIFSSRKIFLTLAAILTLDCLSGCIHSAYKAPKVSMPKQWQEQTTTGTNIAKNENWWKRFNDLLLNSLIDRALRTNNDLAAATIKVRRAQLQSSLANLNLIPTATASVSSTGFNRDFKYELNSQSHSVAGELSYEIDLWGKLSSARSAARFEAEATEADRQSTALSLIDTVASLYWQVAYLNQCIALSKDSIDYSKKVLALVQVRYHAGEVSHFELIKAKQNVVTQEVSLSKLLQQRVEARNALAILFNQAPENGVPERKTLLMNKLPAIAAGMPASVLRRRPDLHAAELRLRACLANVDETRASFYPALTLTGSASSNSSTGLLNILQHPTAALGVGLSLPFIQWNTTKLSIKVSETKYAEAVVNFRQNLYKALGEVENALSANTKDQTEELYLEHILVLARKAEQLTEVKYRVGEVDVQSWLDAQESARAAQINALTHRLNRLKHLMALYKSLGGG
ncbi:Efflux transporter outer membrane subunit [Gammaproteobacteria bacterium]